MSPVSRALALCGAVAGWKDQMHGQAELGCRLENPLAWRSLPEQDR
jgi:hypothetical protein